MLGIEPTVLPTGLESEETNEDSGQSGPGSQVMLLPPPAGSPEITRSPHLTDRQFIWVTYRLSTMDDLEACAAAQVPPDEVIEWRKDPQFGDFLVTALKDKSKTFRDLTAHLLPETGRVLYRLLTSTDLRQQAKGAQMLLRHQGLFLDTLQVKDEAAIASLLTKLREPGQTEILDITPRQ